MKKKIDKKYILMCAAVIAIVIVAIIYASGKKSVTSLRRPGYNSADTIYTLIIDSNGTKQTIQIPVEARGISADELQGAFEETFEVVYELLPGENVSLDEIEKDLVFAENAGKYGLDISYTVDSYEVINCFGEVDNSKITKETDYVITVEITYEDYSQTYDVPVRVKPKVYSEEEQFLMAVNGTIASMNKENSENVKLPQEVNGIKVSFYEKSSEIFPILLLVAVTVVGLVYYKKIALPKKQRDDREKQLKADYAEIVSKLSLLMGAGMSTYNALSKIRTDYKDALKKKGSKIRFAYEEIAIMTNRIASGVSEEVAYADFGRACGIHSYMKLGSLLTQNLKKGSAKMLRLLKDESIDAFEERKALARKAGEEAGTKLLIPMIMMLGIVLVIIIVPAFMSF